MTAEDFRRLALSMPDAIESSHMGHPDFRANGRIFATLTADGTQGMVKVASDEQRVLLADHAAMFEPASGAWGRQGCTMVRLSKARLPIVRGAMLLAWEGVASKPAARHRTARAGAAAPRRRRR